MTTEEETGDQNHSIVSSHSISIILQLPQVGFPLIVGVSISHFPNRGDS